MQAGLSNTSNSAQYSPVRLVQEADSLGSSFYFTVEGKPIFMKGANWVPADVFLPRISKAKYRQLLTAAKEANINMLRVWGGGIYEDNYFYTLCDSLGIYVWQDFMFAGAMYPADNASLENIRREVVDNILRLRKHKCIVLW
jgi:beta-mannosidase